MFLQQRHKHPPDPGSQYPWSASDDCASIYTTLADIAKYTVNLGPLRNSACSQKLSKECNRTWEAIQSCSLTELRVHSRHLEYYRDLICDIQHTINGNTLTEAETDGFICQLNHFLHEFERTTKSGKTCFESLHCSGSDSRPDLFRQINIQHSNPTSVDNGDPRNDLQTVHYFENPKDFVINGGDFGGNHIHNHYEKADNHQILDPGVSNHLKHIKYLLVGQTAVLF